MNKDNLPLIEKLVPVFIRASKPESTVKLVFRSSSPKEKVMLRLAEALNPLGAVIKFLNIQEKAAGEIPSFLWIAIIEFSSPQAEFEEALKKVMESMVREGMADEYYYTFPIKSGYFIDHSIYSLAGSDGRRLAVFSYDNLVGLFVIPRKEYGPSMGALIIEKIGEMYGKTLGAKMKSECRDLGLKTCLEVLHSQGEAKGFLHERSLEAFQDREGIFIRVDFDRLIEEEILLESDIRECGAHQKGVYKGFLSEILEEKLEEGSVEEVRCISKGDKISTFVLKLPPRIKL